MFCARPLRLSAAALIQAVAMACAAAAMLVGAATSSGALGDEWTLRTAASSDTWGGIAYGNGTFVAVAYDGADGRVMTSPDGVTWTRRRAVAPSQWKSVTFGEGLFVAVSPSGGTQVMTSPDGIIWTARTASTTNRWYDVTYGEGIFVAVAESGTGNRVMTSPDGIEWTTRQSAADVGWFGVTHGNGTFVAVGYQNNVMTSPDGVTWTRHTATSALGWYDVVYGGGKFVAVGAMTNATGGVMTSTDGQTWSPADAGGQRTWTAIAHGNGVFAATAGSFPGAQGPTNQNVMTSTDGVAWTLRTAAVVGTTYSGIAYGDGLFVGISSSFPLRVITSGAMFPGVPARPSAVAGDGQATVTVTPGPAGAWASTAYTITATPGGRTCTITVPASSCTVSGLANGTAYTFTATATNVAGVSGPSEPSSPVTPTAPAPAAPPAPPGAPTNLVVTSGNASARAQWAAPAGATGAITYVVTATPRAAMLRSDPGPVGTSTIGLVVDRDGNAYTVDELGRTIIRITPQGVRSTLGSIGSSPRGLAVDARGNLYVADQSTSRVIRVTPLGSTSVLGGTGRWPVAVAVDSAGNVYTSDLLNSSVTKLTPGGTATTVGRAAAGRIAVDAAGMVHVLALNPTDPGLPGVVTRLAPDGASTRLATVSPATGQFAMDPQGNVLAGLAGSGRLARIAPTGAVSILAPGRFGATEGSWAVAADTSGNAYIGSFSFSATTIRPTVDRIAPDGTLTTIAALGGQPRSVAVGPGQAVYWLASNFVGRAIPLAARTCTVSTPEGSTTTPTCTISGLVNGAEYDVTVRAGNGAGTGPPSSAVIARPAGTLQALVAGSTASALSTTVLEVRMQGVTSLIGATATRVASRQQATARDTARTARAVHTRCARSGLRATCRMKLSPGRWRIALTERRSGAIVARGTTVLRVRAARAGAVTG